MTRMLDTNIFIDALRGNNQAEELILLCRSEGLVHASEVTRVELLTGMRSAEESATQGLIKAVTWHSVDKPVAAIAGELGRTWLPRNRGIDLSDFVIAATTIHLDAELITTNVKHFPMFADLVSPY